MTDGPRCPACGTATTSGSGLARHLVDEADRSDAKHVMWLNRHVTKQRATAEELERLLRPVLAGATSTAQRVKR
jgi:hypothetical protein